MPWKHVIVTLTSTFVANKVFEYILLNATQPQYTVYTGSENATLIEALQFNSTSKREIRSKSIFRKMSPTSVYATHFQNKKDPIKYYTYDYRNISFCLAIFYI